MESIKENVGRLILMLGVSAVVFFFPELISPFLRNQFGSVILIFMAKIIFRLAGVILVFSSVLAFLGTSIEKVIENIKELIGYRH